MLLSANEEMNEEFVSNFVTCIAFTHTCEFRAGRLCSQAVALRIIFMHVGMVHECTFSYQV